MTGEHSPVCTIECFNDVKIAMQRFDGNTLIELGGVRAR